MTEPRPADLAAEAERYLAAVAVFRVEGREPQWRPEPGARPRRRGAQRSVLGEPLESIEGRSK